MAEGAGLLRGHALAQETETLAAIDAITAAAPFRHMVTPGGFEMSVAMTNCGAAGWVTDRSGYRYERTTAKRRAVAGDAGGFPRSPTRPPPAALRALCPTPA